MSDSRSWAADREDQLAGLRRALDNPVIPAQGAYGSLVEAVLKPFNGLTPAQAERLDKLTEEHSEVLLEIAHIKLHGYESYHPHDKDMVKNRQLLTKEIGDFLAAVDLMVEAGDIDDLEIQQRREARRRTITRFMHHQ